jgi:fructokinase
LSEDSRPILCLGEAIVDLICERRLRPGETPTSLVPHHGGALANVASAVVRAGAVAVLISGVGSDHWGRWLIDGLEAEGVGTGGVAVLEQTRTPLAIALFDASDEPAFQIYGEHIGAAMAAAEAHLEAALEAGQALVVGANTMVGRTEREVTRKAVRLAREAGLPVLLDPNHRPTRWDEEQLAVKYTLELVSQATVLKCNREEATLLSGEEDPLAAARALALLGPRLVVVTDREKQIVTAGEAEASWTPGEVEVVSPLGAGDAFMGSLAAGLVKTGWDFARAGKVLPEAARDATHCCRHWGARP